MLPVKSAEGSISPMNKISVTEIIIARYSGTRPERKIGKASVATVFLRREIITMLTRNQYTIIYYQKQQKKVGKLTNNRGRLYQN